MHLSLLVGLVLISTSFSFPAKNDQGLGGNLNAGLSAGGLRLGGSLNGGTGGQGGLGGSLNGGTGGQGGLGGSLSGGTGGQGDLGGSLNGGTGGQGANSVRSVLQQLRKIPRAKIGQGEGGEPTVTYSTDGLYNFLRANGLDFLPRISQLPGFTSDHPHEHRRVTIQLNQLVDVLNNKDQLRGLKRSQIAKFIKSPRALHEYLDSKLGLGGNLNGGTSGQGGLGGNLNGGTGGQGGLGGNLNGGTDGQGELGGNLNGGTSGQGGLEGNLNGGTGGQGGLGGNLNGGTGGQGGLGGNLKGGTGGQGGLGGILDGATGVLGGLGGNGDTGGQDGLGGILNGATGVLGGGNGGTNGQGGLGGILNGATGILGGLGGNGGTSGQGGSGLDYKGLVSLLGKVPGLSVGTNKDGEKAITTTISQIYNVLRQAGLSSLPPISQLPGLSADNPNAQKPVTVPISVILGLIQNKDKLASLDPSTIVNILNNPLQAPQILGKLGVDLNGFLGGKGRITHKQRECRRGLIDGLATAIKTATHSITQNAFKNVPRNNILGGVLHGVSALVRHAFSGADFAIQDAACGLGNIADDAARGLNHGRILEGVGSIGREFFGGIDSIGEDAVGQAGYGISRAAQDLFEPLQRPGTGGGLGGLLGGL